MCVELVRIAASPTQTQFFLRLAVLFSLQYIYPSFFFVLENILCLLLQRPDCGVKTSLYYFSDMSVKSDLIGHVWYTNN